MNTKHKVGDKVVIKSEKWYRNYSMLSKENKDALSMVRFSSEMVRYCGYTATIINICPFRHGQYYALDIDDGLYAWADYMFDEKHNDSKLTLTYDELKKMLNEEFISSIINIANDPTLQNSRVDQLQGLIYHKLTNGKYWDEK